MPQVRNAANKAEKTSKLPKQMPPQVHPFIRKTFTELLLCGRHCRHKDEKAMVPILGDLAGQCISDDSQGDKVCTGAM